jgi:hypothetical protein
MTRILYDFLQNGQLGLIDTGMSVDETLAYLGVPDDFDSLEACYEALPDIRQHVDWSAGLFRLRYGSLELLFEAGTDRITFFKVYFHHDHTIPAILNDGWLPVVDGISRARCRDLLHGYHIKSQHVDLGRWANDLCWLWLPSSGVQINFDLEDGNDALLVLSKSDESNPCVNRHCTEFT